ncbi:pentatricopeptide repeat-containing protein At5g40400 isoform X2 [Olea europaea var. sylvestris]|uniref:pentatricopeptide repeat-containing protein At5g40400 isoform X2 n=1 Tax=Olea europaea var. sylvestris TaxID=158386 RepID=UPI000C1D5D20|nr:pentatricopeptide repeat-containing protein At5g40400 isoform X2 [Olea europaea var. sylvestris]
MIRMLKSVDYLPSVSTLIFTNKIFQSNSKDYSSSSLQTITESNQTKIFITNPLYNFLSETQNPNNLVNLICSSLKQKNDAHLALLQEKGLFREFTNHEMFRVLLRCQADSSTALAFFNWVKNDLDKQPSTQNYCIIIHILAWSKNFKQAMEVMLELVELKRNVNSSESLTVFKILLNCTDKCNWDPVVFDMLIKAYLKKGMVRESFQAFRKVVKLGFVPSTITINCLLIGISRMNCGEKCWEIYEEMVRIGAHPNSCTFNILTHVLCKEGDVNKVNKFLERMEEEGFDPDIVTYNMLIDSYCKKRRLKDAVYMYNIMNIRGVMPDLITHTTLINGLCKGGNAREAHRLFHQMIHRGLKPDVFSYNTLICGYCKEGMMQEARSLVLDMIDCGVNPDSFTCWMLVKGYQSQDKLISAMNLVVELLRFRVSISGYAYDYLIFALCKENRPFAAKSLLERISQDGYEPNADIYNELIDSLCKSSSSVEEALKLKVEMVAKDVKPNLCAYRAIIRRLCGLNRSKEAESLMREMVESGFQPDVEICRALMNGHCKEKNFREAESLLGSLSKEFQIFDAECYNALASLLSEEAGTTELMEFQDRMMKVGFAPNILTYGNFTLVQLKQGNQVPAVFDRTGEEVQCPLLN